MAKFVRASRSFTLAAFVSSRTRIAAAAALALLSALQAAPAAAQSYTPACTGNAPGGELVAQRVHTNPSSEAGLLEGPVWVNGALYFSNFTFQAGYPSRIQKLSQDGTVSTVLDNAGTNGMAVDAQGNLVTANHKYSGIVRINPITLQQSTVTNQYNGAPFNSPNDLAIAADGTIYFSDPSYQHDPALPGQPSTNVYRRAPNGTVTVVDSTLTQPNGVTLSPNGSVLYVATGAGTVRAYPIVGGLPQTGSTFLSGLESPDGMAVDCFGNLYVTEHTAQRVRVFSPAGKQLALIRVDANITNVAFGNADRRTLYITGAGAVWKLQLSAPGNPY